MYELDIPSAALVLTQANLSEWVRENKNAESSADKLTERLTRNVLNLVLEVRTKDFEWNLTQNKPCGVTLELEQGEFRYTSETSFEEILKGKKDNQGYYSKFMSFDKETYKTDVLKDIKEGLKPLVEKALGPKPNL